eukprot:104283_1
MLSFKEYVTTMLSMYFVIYGFCIMVLYHDVKGHWDKYRIISEPQNIKNKINYRKAKYIISAISTLKLYFLVLPACHALCGYYYSFNYYFSDYNIALNILFTFILEFIRFKITRTVIVLNDTYSHYISHKYEFIYVNIHKYHHYHIKELCCLGANRAPMIEFFFSWLISHCVFPSLIGCHWITILFIEVIGFINSQIAHCGFVLDELVLIKFIHNSKILNQLRILVGMSFDAKDHIVHHLQPSLNIAPTNYWNYYLDCKGELIFNGKGKVHVIRKKSNK